MDSNHTKNNYYESIACSLSFSFIRNYKVTEAYDYVDTYNFSCLLKHFHLVEKTITKRLYLTNVDEGNEVQKLKNKQLIQYSMILEKDKADKNDSAKTEPKRLEKAHLFVNLQTFIRSAKCLLELLVIRV